MTLRGHLGSGEAMLVQETYDPAWSAYTGGKPLPIEKDYAGFMLIRPGSGNREVTLRFETPLENRIGYIAFWLSSLLAAIVGIISLRRSRTL
jgi:uncharacterized membrane protein YfhO